MIISIASGKGGTGKTTVAVNLALSLSNGTSCQFLDCDVEEPNAAIFLKPEFTQTISVSIPVPQVDFTKCTFCGKCAEVCAYNAIAVLKNDILVFNELCHGCGGCSLFCPENAISEVNREIGVIESGNAGKIEFIQGRLNIGEAMATPIIREMKKKIRESETRRNGETEKHSYNQLPFNYLTIQPSNHLAIIDVPPGTSCPVIESVKNSDFTILVTEPTPFGLNDLILAIEVVRKLKIPFGVVINRANIGNEEVGNYCKKVNIPILMEIPFDRKIAETYSKGIPIVEAIPEYRKRFGQLFKNIEKILKIKFR